jgi:Glycosyltransferase involved in LPS biosynthesis
MAVKFKTYLINLEKSSDRLKKAQDELDAAGITFERIPAVYGPDLSSEALHERYSSELNQYQYYKNLNAGEIGCFLSHRRAWQQILNDDLDYALVLEDDFAVEPFASDVLQLAGEIKQKWDYIKLIDTTRRRKSIWEQPLTRGSLIVFDKLPAGTCAQLVSRSGAEKLLRATAKFGRPIDIDLQHWWEKGIDIFGITPYAFVKQRGFASEIDVIGQRKKERRRALRRFVNQVLFKIRNARENGKRLKSLKLT